MTELAAGSSAKRRRLTCSSCSVAVFCSDSAFVSAPAASRDACSSSILSCSMRGCLTTCQLKSSCREREATMPPGTLPCQPVPELFESCPVHAEPKHTCICMRARSMSMEAQRRHAFSRFLDLRCCTRSACTSFGFALNPFFEAAPFAEPSLHGRSRICWCCNTKMVRCPSSSRQRPMKDRACRQLTRLRYVGRHSAAHPS